jgi:hypothetical protein
VTITMVGYGDIVPATVGGKVVASVMVYVGIVLIALVVTILGNSYLQTEHAARVGNLSLTEGLMRRSFLIRRRGSLNDMSGAVEFQESSSNSANIPIPETQPFALEQVEYGDAEERLVTLVSAATDFMKKREAIERSLDYCILETMQAVTMQDQLRRDSEAILDQSQSELCREMVCQVD